MAFMRRTTGPGGLNPMGGEQQKLDQGQIEKLKELGMKATPVSSDPTILDNARPSAKEVLPGTAIGGYEDAVGNFYVVDDRNLVVKVEPEPSGIPVTGGPLIDPSQVITTAPPFTPTTPIGGGPITGGPITGGPITGGPIGGGGGGGPVFPPTTPPPPQQPPNFGSGKIFSRFEVDDVVPNQHETITRALWSGNVGNLVTFYTSSAQTTTQKRYYYEIFNSASGDCGSEAQFSIAYGHKAGSGSADEGGQINDTPSRAIYGQYRLLCLDGDTPRFTIGGSTTDHIYVINVNRARMREFLDEGNIEINLAHLSGSEYSGAINTYTGSNVTLAGTGQVLRLIDDSTINSATITEQGEVYNIVSGSIEDGVYNSSNPHVFGQLYRRLGIVVLDANKLDATASFGSVTGSEVAGDNAYKLYMAMSGAAQYTDASGDRLGFAGRSSEIVKSTHYFVRVKNSQYNFSNNPTYTTGSEGDLSEPTFINDPVVYITTVGLYNERKECIAVAKVSRAIQKSFTKEALVKVKLEF
jgi:hypothetical protein